MKKKLLLAALCAVFLSSCQEEEGLDTTKQQVLTQEELVAISSHFSDNKVGYAEAIEQANQVIDFLGQGTKFSRRTIKSVDIVLGSRNALTKGGEIEDGTDSLVYLMNFDDDMGYVMVSGDTRTDQILGFAESGNISTNEDEEITNQALNVFLTNAETAFENQILEVEEMEAKLVDNALSKIDSDTRFFNIRIVTGAWKVHRTYAPLVKVEWGQGSPYNNNAPLINNKRAWAGCVAVATAQIQSYWKFPLSYNWQLINSHKSNWSSNPVAYSEIAKLFRAIGDNVSMTWGLASSGADSRNVPNHFAKMGYRNRGTMQEYNFDKIVSAITLGIPVYARGYSTSSTYSHRHWFLGKKHTHTEYGGGHAWVYDGFLTRSREVTVFINNQPYSYTQYENLIHCNYGWDGTDNGYYNDRAFNTNVGPVVRSGEEGNFQFILEMMPDIKPF